VNKNIYTDKRDVYLLGGPGPNAPPGAGGLPDGNYYFQVTDPSGKKLLSEDAVLCREFVVEGGVFTEYLGVGRVWEESKGNFVPCHKDGWEYGMHDTGFSIDHNSLTIQLMPYANTPNNGGVYKVWATPTEHFDGNPEKVNNPGKFHGFIPRYSKTDNFKVKVGQPPEIPELKICKFEDTNGNGLFDDGEPAMESWIITVTDPLGVTNVYWTGEDGCVVIDVPVNGKYLIEEELPEDWSVTATIVNGEYVVPTNVVEITVSNKNGDLYTVTFGNFEEFCVDGYKYNDLNGDGDWDTGEPGLENWKITLYRSTDGGATWTEYAHTYTDSNGYYEICVDVGGDFKVVEEDPAGWSPTSQTYFTFVATSGTDQGPFNFFNFQCFYVEGYKYEDMNGDGNWDPGDLGIEGWTITLYKLDASGAWLVFATTTTDSNGYYSFYVCEGGEFKVAEEERTGWSPTSPTSFQFTAISGTSHTYNFFNFECFDVDGYKYEDMNGDGDWDAGDLGIEGWTITLYKKDSSGAWQVFATTTTDSNGYYSFEVCVGGEFKVVEEDRAGWSPTSPTSFQFTAVSGTSRSYDFFNFECFYVEGYKYEDMNGDGDWDAGDTGVPGWHITLYKKDASGNWQFFDETDTDGSGKYSFYVCEPGEFKVEEEVQDGWIATAPTYHTFTAVSGQLQTFDFFNFQLGRICGEKWYDVDQDGVKDGSEVTIEGFKIELWKDGSLIDTVFTDAYGEYCFEGLGPGDYEVKEIMPNDPGEYQEWAPTYPEDGIWHIGAITSGYEKLDADFGNVVYYAGGLTWGYWKTHTGHMSPPRDPAYDLLPDHPMPVDVPTPNDDYLIDSDDEAYWLFWGMDTGESPDCDGKGKDKCRSLFRAQLLALHMNLLKFPGMGDALYFYDDGTSDTVQDIYDEALALLNDGNKHDFTDFQEILDRINNNGHTHILVIPTPPEPEY
jgi:hypothetical protein